MYLTHTFNLYFDHEKKTYFQITEASTETQCIQEMESLVLENMSSELELFNILPWDKEKDSFPGSVPFPGF